MISQSFLPSLPLREYVRKYHIRHFEFDGSNNLPFKPYPPRPEQGLVFYPREPETVEYVDEGLKYQRPHSMIMGQYTIRTNRHTAKDFIVLIADFQPGVLHRLTGIPIDKLTNTDVDAVSVLGKEIRLVNERLNSTGNYQEMIDIVETFLFLIVNRLKKDSHSVDEIGKLIYAHSGKFSLDWLARQACLCQRQFERKFKERLGVGPKTYSRIARLYQSYKMKVDHPGEDWLSIALACGYHDYQHLAKDYREFSNSTPSALFHENDKAPEKQFGLPETF